MHEAVYTEQPSLYLEAAYASILHHPVDIPKAVVFAVGLNHRVSLSVRQTDRHDSGKRLVVSQRWTGNWMCSGRGCRGRCEHVDAAVTRCIEINIMDHEGALVLDEPGNEAVEDELERQERLASLRRALALNPPVSHLPRGPSAFLRFDDAFDARFPHLPSPKVLPTTLVLDDGARCRCGAKPTAGERHDVRITAFVVYGHREAETVQIETLLCSHCPKRRIGPDLLQHGLVNWNNQIGFRREVFDSYLNQYTKSETPLTAYHATLVDEYTTSELPCMSEPTYRRAFFAFSDLHQIQTRMACPKCGPSPSVVICDGSRFGIEAHRTTGSWRPPTMPDTGSRVRPDVHSISTAPLSDKALRTTPAEASKLRKQLRDYVKLLPQIAAPVPEELEAVLAQVSNAAGSFGHAVVNFVRALGGMRSGRSRQQMCMIGRQVCARQARRGRALPFRLLTFPPFQLLPSTGLLSLVPPEAFDDLRDFVESGTRTLLLRKRIPVLSEPEVDTEPVRELFRVLLRRAERVMEALCASAAQEEPLGNDIANLAPPLEDSSLPEFWKTSGAAYGSAKIRSRPIYPRLPNDAGMRRLNGQPVKDLEIDEDVCGKYYST